MASTDQELLTAITPTEAVLLYGDLAVKGYPSPGINRELVPTSGKAVDGDDLVHAAMVTLAAAVVSRGVVATVEMKRFLILWKTPRIQLRLQDTTNPWPSGSPEARLVDWLGQRPGRSGGLEEAAIALFIPKRYFNVWRIAYQSLHDGLVARGYVERRVVKLLKVMKKEQFTLAPQYLAPFTRTASAFERAQLRVKDKISAEVQEAAATSWRAALAAQEASSD